MKALKITLQALIIAVLYAAAFALYEHYYDLAAGLTVASTIIPCCLIVRIAEEGKHHE